MTFKFCRFDHFYRSFTSTAALWLCAATLVLTPAFARADSPVPQVQTALDSLDQWLGQGADGDKWRSYLKTNELQTLLANPAAADKKVVAEIAGQFAGSAPGLSEPRFVAVRRALEAWLAELSRLKPEEIPAAALAAKDSFQEVTAEQAAAAKATLQKAVEQLDRYLGTGANGQAWRKFLLWDSLRASLAEGATPDFSALDDVALKLGSQRRGLNVPQFVAVSRALKEYRRLGRVAADPMAKEAYGQQLDALSKALESYTQSPTETAARQIGTSLGWLQARGQAKELVAAVQQYYCQPNVLMEISEPLVAVGLARTVNETAPVTDVILGTRISGTGHTTGSVAVDLVPSDQWGIIDSLFNGHVESRTVGLNGPARINSAGHTNFQVRKRIFVNRDGIVSPPATAAARTQSDTLGVSAGGRIASSIARGRVAGSKPQAEAISADHAEDRITQRVDDEADPKIREGNDKYRTKIRQPLADRGQFPSQLKFSSTDSAMNLVALQAAGGQIAAPGPAPTVEVDRSLTLRIHETAVNNLAAGVLSGEKITKKEFQQEYKDLFGKVPEEWQNEEGTWTITFHNEQPVTVLFSDSSVKITLQVKRVEGVADSKTPWRITAEYKLERDGGDLKAVRQGEQIEIEALNEDAGGRSVAEKANVRRQFEKTIFKPEYVQHGLELPGDWAKAGKLPLVHLLSDKGWLALAWIKP